MKNKIKTIIIISFVAALAITSVVNLSIFGRILKKNFTSDLESELLLLGDNLQTQMKRITSFGISSRDVEGFDQKCLELIKKHQYLSEVMIVDNRGVIVFHNSPSRRGQSFPIENISVIIQAGSEKVISYTERKKKYYCSILPFGDNPGYDNEYAVIVSASTAFISHRVESILKNISVGMFLVLIVIISGFYLIISTVIDSKIQIKPDAIIADEKQNATAESGCDEKKPHMWIWEVDMTGRYTYSNTEVVELLGYSPEELVGRKHFYDMFLLQERETLKVIAFEKFAEKLPFEDFINANLHKNGQVVWLATSGTPILDKDGNLQGYRGCDIFIADRKKNLTPVRAGTGSSV
jgi:PAS domain S-box-containing protein